MNSIWSKDLKSGSFNTVKEDMKTQVLIIGGGITGLLCAHFLKENGVEYVLVEQNKILNGVTKNTTAKITLQHGLIYNKLIKNVGFEKAQQYLEVNKQAVEKYFQMCKKIDCDFEIKDSFVYSLSDRKKIEDEIKALEQLGQEALFMADLPLPVKAVGAVKIKNQAQFNPIKFLNSLSKDLNIYENSKVTEVNGDTVICNGKKIVAQKIIFATHFPFKNTHGSYFLKMYQHRSYVIALKGAKNINGMYVDENLKGLSFRNYGEYLLLGGGSHRTGKNGGSYAELRNFAKEKYPNLKEEYSFATQDCMALDSVPYIGNYSKNTPNWYVATGFNKWGITSSMVAAMILCDMVQEKENYYSNVFSPSRSILKPQLVVNGIETAVNLLNPMPKRCTHLGCALKWNAAEHTWDCGCHGSRFTEDGKVINNPAQKDLK